MGKEEGCSGVAQKVKGRKVNGFFKVNAWKGILKSSTPQTQFFFVFRSSKRYLRHFLHFLYWGRAGSFSFFLD